MTLWAHVKSAASLAFITINLLVWCGPLAILAVLKWAVPGRRSQIDAAMDWIYRAATRLDDFWLDGVLGLSWNRPALDLRRDEMILVLSNHVSWADIFVIQSVIAIEGPILKFLAKRELVRIPIFGLIFWAFDFPLLDRNVSRRDDDLAALRAACESVRTRPAALMNFAEGTRFSEEKRVARGSRFDHLLDPKAGGFSALVEALGPDLDRIIDLTLIYPIGTSFWKFLSGDCDPIRIEARSTPRTSLGEHREAWRDWLEEAWAIKDRTITEHRE